MKKNILSLFLICSISQLLYAQKNNSDSFLIPQVNCSTVKELSNYIKQNFITHETQVRAIYVWIANNISYNVELLQQIKNKTINKPPEAEDVLKTRSAVCQGYSELFNAICKNIGINALIISGYTKQGGKVSPISHAWVAVEQGGDWYLYDPTWGAGYVNNNVFTRRFNNAFYKQLPKDFIIDHMPFDPLYQFLLNPLKNNEFENGSSSASKIMFNYKDSLKQYNLLSDNDKIQAEVKRIEIAGIDNDFIQERVSFLKKNILAYSSKNSAEESNKTFTLAINQLNNYFALKNLQFRTITDKDLSQLIDSIKNNYMQARTLMSQAVAQNDAQQKAKTANLANLDQFWKQVDIENQFVKNYLSSNINVRKELFRKKAN